MFLKEVYKGYNQWYFYLITLLVVFLATQLGSIPLLIYAICENPDLSELDTTLSTLSNTNLGLALMLFTFFIGFWALLFCVKFIHQKPIFSIITARKQIDWYRIFFAAGLWGILGLSATFLPMFFTENTQLMWQFNPEKFLGLLIISFTLFPFQTSFEELMFRGYLMQWCSYLFQYRWISILITGTLFGLMHGANPEIETFGIWIALPQYIFIGLLLGYLTVKDNGTELALGFHMANNIIAALTITGEGLTLQTHALFKDLNPTASWPDTAILLLFGLLFIWISNKKYNFIHQNCIWEKITSSKQDTKE